MSFYAATLGELIIIEAFVIFIWLKVLVNAIGTTNNTLDDKKVLITSVGLVCTAASIMGLMFIRAAELTKGYVHLSVIMICYIGLAVGNIMFLISASLGNSYKQIILFLIASGIWTTYALWEGMFNV